MHKRVLWWMAGLICGCESTEDPMGTPIGDVASDEFDGGLNAWSRLNDGDAAVAVDNGVLRLDPAANSLWFNERSAFLLYQAVEGDFSMTAHVVARRLSAPSQPPQPQFRLGGIMARDPSGGSENYVFIVLGADGDDVSVETKSTEDGRSMFQGPPWPSAEADLRVCRVGDRFGMYIRGTDGGWQEQAVFDRPDLGPTLQLGPMAYANAPDPDVRVSFDFVRFAPVSSVEACTMP